MNLQDLQDLLNEATFDAVMELGVRREEIDVLVHDVNNYAGAHHIANVSYRNGRLYITLGDEA